MRELRQSDIEASGVTSTHDSADLVGEIKVDSWSISHKVQPQSLKLLGLTMIEVAFVIT
jgi:hypothetical protein